MLIRFGNSEENHKKDLDPNLTPVEVFKQNNVEYDARGIEIDTRRITEEEAKTLSLLDLGARDGSSVFYNKKNVGGAA